MTIIDKDQQPSDDASRMSDQTRDVLTIAQSLMQRQSITPHDDGAQDVLADFLKPLGFAHYDISCGDENAKGGRVRNSFFLLSRERDESSPKAKGRHFCFAGHTDVVPPGKIENWRHPPFASTVENEVLYGRGAADMKGNIACFVAAVAQYASKYGGLKNALPPGGTISLLITGDEEGPAINGTDKVLDWMDEHGHIPDFCLVGEPTNPSQVGDAIKIGRRGSLGCWITLRGKRGHIAYPKRADNPIPRMVEMLDSLTKDQLDQGSEFFEASSLQVATIDVGNPASNVIPEEIKAFFNVRFNDLWSAQRLQDHLMDRMAPYLKPDDEVIWHSNAESFLTQPNKDTDLVLRAIEDITNNRPEISTSGGTSDARFIQKYCPVVEFGLVNQTIHQVNECVPLADLRILTHIYGRILEKFFENRTGPL